MGQAVDFNEKSDNYLEDATIIKLCRSCTINQMQNTKVTINFYYKRFTNTIFRQLINNLVTK